MINQYSPLVFWGSHSLPSIFSDVVCSRQVSTPEPFRGDAALSAQLTDSEQSRRACLRGLLQKAVLGQDPDGPGDGSASHGNMETWTLWAPKIMGNMEMASSHLQTLAILFNPSSFRVGHFDPDPMLWRNFISDVVWIQPERFHWVT